MKRLPARPDFGHLKKQAKDLLALYRHHNSTAIARFRAALPSAAGRSDREISHLDLRLHDAQSCVAREYGFSSWSDLKSFVTVRLAQLAEPATAVMNWLRLAYAGEISGVAVRANAAAAVRLFDEGMVGDDPYLACAVGDMAVLRRAIERDAEWVNRPGGPLKLPPLLAVTHSSLSRLPAFRGRLHAAASLLLAAGADPNQAVGSRSPPASLNEPSTTDRLSALYGAAGQNHDPEMTRLMLQAGADPNDGESLYHSLENTDCVRLLLQAGARVAGSNALYRVLDLDNIEALRLLLAHGGDANEPASSRPTSDWGTLLLWAIRRRRSPAHIQALLEAGADASVRTPDGATAYILALRFGLSDVADLLRVADAELPADEQFIAACARGDNPAARQIKSMRPDLPTALSPTQLRLLPELAAQGRDGAVRLMVRLGWPVAVTGGDWDASALNQAVFRGDARLAWFLLEHGASWTEKHGFGDNVCGTLSWASLNQPVDGGDWAGCAEALVAHGMPGARPDPERSDRVLVDGRRSWFSDEVMDVLLGAAPQA